MSSSPPTPRDRAPNPYARVLADLLRDPDVRAALVDALSELAELEREPPPALLTADETAQLLRVSVSTLYRLNVPFLVIGHARRWRRADVESWLEARRSGDAGAEP